MLLGICIGALPGLSATMGIALLTPITFWLPKAQGFAMMMGLWNAAIFAGGITAILINTPGTPASITQAFDGYALYKQGKGGLALGINTIYSFIGGMISILMLILGLLLFLWPGKTLELAATILGVALLIWGIRIGPGGGITNQVIS